jgi:hypothetical protein
MVALLLDLLKQTGADYCVIGGPDVNACAEPVVSLDKEQASERPGGYPPRGGSTSGGQGSAPA